MADAVLTFHGSVEPGRFEDFCAKRARLLSLDIRFTASNGEAVTVLVKGHPVLIDMFEMACSLGPDGSVVQDVQRPSAERANAA